MIFVDVQEWGNKITASLMSYILTQKNTSYHASYHENPIPNINDLNLLDYDPDCVVIFHNILLEPPWVKRDGNLYSMNCTGPLQKYYYYTCYDDNPRNLIKAVKKMCNLRVFL